MKKTMTLKERAERREMWISKSTSHIDTPKIRKEAGEKFDQANPVEECTDYKKK